MVFPCLSFLQLGNASSDVLTWLIGLVTGGGVINYVVMTVTYIFFYNACKAQGLDRSTLPYYARFQPYCGYIGLCWMTVIVFTYGYTAFRSTTLADGTISHFDIVTFFTDYTMLGLDIIFFIGWKLIKRTKFVSPLKADLVWERPTIDAYEESFTDKPLGFWQEMIQIVGLAKRTGGNDQRRPSIVP